ncbi:MAG: hypothetical protein LBG15_16060 [Dysgonamonadaceae bacterium]|jgi:hypothetical protein|nr:hypothetical protein [Dysgonamonadaceae bacterium]
MKIFLNFLLLVVGLTFTFILFSHVLPNFQTFKEADEEIDFSNFIYVAINSFWLCSAILYISKKSYKTNKEIILRLSFSLFFIYAFMPQIETLLFKSAFFVVSRTEILFMMIAAGVPVVLSVLLGVKLFRDNFKPSRYSRSQRNFTVSELTVKLLLSGFFYLIIYFVFNYFIAWQIEDFRIFYTGSSEKIKFEALLIEIWNTNPSIYLFQFARGVLFGIFILPIVDMFKNKSLVMLTCIILLFEASAVHLIIPDLLLPDTVRMGHLLETTSSLFLFSIINWLMFKKIKSYGSNYKYY